MSSTPTRFIGWTKLRTRLAFPIGMGLWLPLAGLFISRSLTNVLRDFLPSSHPVRSALEDTTRRAK